MFSNASSHHFIVRFFVLLLSLISTTLTYAEINSSVLEQLKKDHIVDTTQTLTIDQIQHLQQQNELLYKEKNIDFKILMIPTTDNESVEQYALDIFNTLKIGNEKLDNGLLLVIAKDERKMRFEVGYGLEGELTDIEAGRIIRHDLAPYFQQHQYYDGIRIAMNSVFRSVSSLNKNNDLSHTENEVELNADEEYSLGTMILILMLYGISGLICAIPFLLLFLYFRNSNKAKTPLPEIVIGTDGKQYIRVKKNRERPFEPYSKLTAPKEQKSSSGSTFNLNPSSSSKASSTPRDSGGSSGGGGASGSW